MDIVHLMETSGIDPVQGHGTRTYADTEQSLALDHSEGKWLLPRVPLQTALCSDVLAQAHLSALMTELELILKAQTVWMDASMASQGSHFTG